MAIGKKHDNKYNGARGFLNQNFGKDQWGDSYLSNLWYGATTPFHLKANDGFITGLIGCAVVPVMLMAGTAIYVLETNEDVDLDFSSQRLSAEELTALNPMSFQYSGERILAHQNAEGEWALYKDHSSSDIDDQYVLITDADDALDIAQKYRGHFEEVSYALNHDLGDMPETVPYVISYESMTPIYNDGDAIYRIADNLQQQSSDVTVHSLTAPQATQATQAYATWQRIASDIVQDGYDPIEDFAFQPIAQETPFDHDGIELLQLLGIIYGAAMGLGAAVGAASGTMSSRKRFNRELGL